MATYAGSTFGRLKGSVGSATAYNLKGQGVVRSKPLSVSNPRTQAQVQQRDANTLLVALAKLIIVVIRASFFNRPRVRSQYNQFVALNNQAITRNPDGTVELVPAQVVLGDGDLKNAAIIPEEVLVDEAKFNWVDNTDGVNAFADDELHIVLIAKGTELNGYDVFDFPAVAKRSEETVTIHYNTNQGDFNFLFVWANASKRRNSYTQMIHVD